MRLDIFEENNFQKWNDIINSSVNGTLYHTWDWLKIVEKHSSSKLFPLVFFDADDDKPFGAIPLFYMKKLGVKMIFSPPPGSAITLGPVFADKSYKQHKFELAYLDFQAGVDDFIKKIGSSYTLMTTSPGFLDVRPFLWTGYSVDPSYTYKIDLSQGEQTIWRNFSRTLRQDINSSLSKGIRIIESNLDGDKNIDYIYDSLSDRYNKQHRKYSLEKVYLRDIFKEFGHRSIKLLLAMYKGNPVGATIFTLYKDTITAWVGAARFESNDLEVNGCIYREVISSAIKDGYRWFEIMGANTRHLNASKSKYSPTLDICFVMRKKDLLGSLAEKAYMLQKKMVF